MLSKFLQKSKEPEISNFLEKKKIESIDGREPFSFLSTHDGFELVRRGEHAFQCEAQTAFQIIRSTFDKLEVCDLNMLEFQQTVLAAFVIRRESPFHSILATKYVIGSNIIEPTKRCQFISLSYLYIYYIIQTILDA